MRKFLYTLVCLFCFASTLTALELETDWTRSFELDGGYTIFYTGDSALSITKTDATSRQPVFHDEFCSEPIVSPDKTRAAFLYPYDFEAPSELLLFDTADGKVAVLELADLEYQHIPIRITWLNERFLLVIAGYGLGTNTFGGDVYYYDLATGKNAKLMDAVDVQIVNIGIVESRESDKADGLWLDFFGPESCDHAGRYYYKLARLKPRQFIPMDNVNELMRQDRVIEYHAAPDDAMNRLACLAGWLLTQMPFR